jgi:hypothetical protein
MVFVPHAVTEIPQTSSNASTKWSVLSREPIDWYARRRLLRTRGKRPPNRRAA